MDDLEGWAERRLDAGTKGTAKAVRAVPGAFGTDYELPADEEEGAEGGGGELTEELLDAIAELANRITAIVAAWPPEMLEAPAAETPAEGEEAAPAEEVVEETDEEEPKEAGKYAGNPEGGELSPEKKEEILGEISAMPEPVQEGFKSWLGGQGESPLSWEKAQSLAGDIAAKRDIESPEDFGAWLFWSSKAV